MKNDLKSLHVFPYGKAEIRTVIIDGAPWFAAADICDALGLSENCLAEIDESEQQQYQIQPSDLWEPVISTWGLYCLGVKCGEPEGVKLVRWLTYEVLPVINRCITYTPMELAEEMIQDPAFGIQLLEALQAARLRINKLEKEVTGIKLLVEDQQVSSTSILVADMAKTLQKNGIDIGSNRLFQWLRENGYLIDGSGENRNMPTERSLRLGLFEVRKSPVALGGKLTKVAKTPMITVAGQQYFIDIFNQQRQKDDEITLWELTEQKNEEENI